MPTQSHAHACIPASMHPIYLTCTALTICAVAVRRQGATRTPPATLSSGPPPAPLQFLPRMSVSQSFRGCVWVSRSREACSVCDRGEFVRSSERAFVSLGVRGCSGRPYGPSTLIGNEYTCESSRPCCLRRSRVAPVLGGVNKSIIRCEYMLKLGVFCVALVIMMHKET